MSARLSRAAAVVTVVAVALAIGGYAAYRALTNLTAAPPPAPGCTIGAAGRAFQLDPDQAGIAATIAGVADWRRLPERAVTVAYAAALQESDLQDLGYGDRDSVGIFQQRPSEGWGTTAQIENPVYATSRFFTALVNIPGYTKIPVSRAAQDVQHSADGTAYQQYAYTGTVLADAFTGRQPRQVTCWYQRAASAAPSLTDASQGLRGSFGPSIRAIASRHSLVVQPRRGEGWAMTSWLVAHAEEYQLSQVRYAGYEWKAANGTMGWHRIAPAPVPSGSIVAD